MTLTTYIVILTPIKSLAAQSLIASVPQKSCNWSLTSASSAKVANNMSRSRVLMAQTNARTGAGSSGAGSWFTVNAEIMPPATVKHQLTCRGPEALMQMSSQTITVTIILPSRLTTLTG